MINFSNQQTNQLMDAAYAHHMAGRLPEAEKLYRQVLAINPAHADAWHLLGTLACQVQQPAAAVECISKAVAINPRIAAFHSNLGEAHRQAGNLDRAEAEFKQAIALDGGLWDAYTNLASVYVTRERWQDSRLLLESLLQKVPNHANGWRLLGDALAKLNLNDQALAAYQRALQLKPDFADASFNLGAMLAQAGRLEEAERAFRQAIAGAPADWEARLKLAEVLERQTRRREAYEEVTALIAKNPNYAPAYSLQANLLRGINRLDEALQAYARAVQMAPEDWATRCNMAFALRDQARLAESLDMLRKLLAEDPDRSPVRSGLIFTMFLVPEITPAQIAAEQALWNRRHGDPVAAQRTPHANDMSPDRRLRIGYVSSDFRNHPVGRFMLPLIKNHDRSQVEVFCYRGSPVHDAMTDQIAAAADHFTPISELDDGKAAEVIRADRIDILIDLSNHTIDNRLMLFARKPAPVQISYLAFCAGTGIEQFDWRLTDPLIDPPGVGDDAPFEKPLRLAETYWCYAPIPEAGAITPLPARTGGHITFGSFNYFSKCNDQVLALWARLLTETPTSRLMLHVSHGSRQEYVKAFFARNGIAADRLTLCGRASETDYFLQYARVDIALDTFPWAGGTTTCDALYMGVPVITLAGEKTIQRGGITILTNLGAPEWIARTPDDYIQIAKSLSSDFGRLSALRANLRTRMQTSPLMNAPRFAHHLESSLRHAWHIACGQK